VAGARKELEKGGAGGFGGRSPPMESGADWLECRESRLVTVLSTRWENVDLSKGTPSVLATAGAGERGSDRLPRGQRIAVVTPATNKPTMAAARHFRFRGGDKFMRQNGKLAPESGSGASSLLRLASGSR